VTRRYHSGKPVTPVPAEDVNSTGGGGGGGGGVAASERLGRGGDGGREHMDLERIERRLKSDVSVVASDSKQAKVL